MIDANNKILCVEYADSLVNPLKLRKVNDFIKWYITYNQ
ncbi:hypothetical protein MCAV_01180 [[Mycoplasma] cavipharyngis]